MRINQAAVVLSTGLSFASAPAAAQLHEGDIILTVVDNAIVTGAASTPGVRAFGAVFGVAFPDFTSDPGFDSAAGTFPTNTSIGFNILDAVRLWDGEDFDAVSPSTISIELGPLGPVVSPSQPGGFSAGFTVPVQSGGQWHRHFDYILDPPASAGVYLLKVELFHTGAIAPSAPFYIVFNQNVSMQTHQEAFDHVVGVILAPSLIGDVNGDGVVNASDLALLLGAWGTSNAAADVDENGVVNAADLARLLGAWTG